MVLISEFFAGWHVWQTNAGTRLSRGEYFQKVRSSISQLERSYLTFTSFRFQLNDR